ncbi:AsmA family protein [Vibrio agarivorans]|uniref:AsmA family protein n=1 Tax=Vibrio agarivorans TaxID=153622 RepID=UPI002230D39A|nr:AsmA family protein [Vibrio agarivorans]MDN3661238.1 AsmA family protein [Vibrio agarivorans]
MKKLFIALGVIVVVLIGAVVALVTLVNPNQFKPLIVEQVKKNTGYELVIDGDLSWEFFPSVGLSIGRTELRNPQGFSQQNLFSVDRVGVDVSVMPLLEQKLEIGNVVLDGATVSIERLNDGSTNLDPLTQNKESTPQEPQAQSSDTAGDDAEGASEPWSITLEGISITNASLSINDLQQQQITELQDVNLTLSKFDFDQWASLQANVKGKNNQQSFAADLGLEFKLAKDFTNYELRNIALQASFDDEANKIQSANIKLDTFAFDQLNAITFEVVGQLADLSLNTSGAAQLQVDQAIQNIALNEVSIETILEGDSLPVSPLNSSLKSDIKFDVANSHLDLVLSQFSALDTELDGKLAVTLSDIAKVRFSLHSPNIDVDALTAKMAGENTQGKDEDAGSSDSQTASSEKQQEPDLSALKTLDVQGDIAIDKFKASNVKLDTVKAVVKVNRGIAELSSFSANLYQGSIAANARLDGNKTPAAYTTTAAVKGVKVLPLLVDAAEVDVVEGTGNIDLDLAGKSLTPTGIKQNLAGTVKINFEDGAVHGINVAQLIRENYAKFTGKKIDDVDGPQKTDFSAMTATLRLNKGVMTTNDLAAQSPLLRVRGEGQANYLKETMDMTISTSVVGSLKGQGGADIDELKDVTIPVRIHGTWAQPKFALVFDDVMKAKAQKEIDRGLKKLDEKLGDKIKDEKTREAVDGLLKGLFN